MRVAWGTLLIAGIGMSITEGGWLGPAYICWILLMVSILDPPWKWLPEKPVEVTVHDASGLHRRDVIGILGQRYKIVRREGNRLYVRRKR